MKSPKIQIRSMNIADIPAVYQIEKDSFQYPWPKKEFFVELVRNRFAKYFVCYLEKEMVGFLGLWLILDEAHIANIAVKPTYRKKGIGHLLMNFGEQLAVQARCKTIVLEVGISNSIALDFYKQRGYKVTYRRKNYYAHSFEDAYEMIKELNNACAGN